MVDYLRNNREEVRFEPEMAPGGADVGEGGDGLLVEGGLLHQLDEAERTIVFGLYVAGLTCKELGGRCWQFRKGL